MEVPPQYSPGSNNLPFLISLPTLDYLPSQEEKAAQSSLWGKDHTFICSLAKVEGNVFNTKQP